MSKHCSTADGPMEVWTDQGICVLNRVFVRGIPSKMTELQLEVLFGGMGYEIQNVRIVEDIRTGVSKGYGFVTFRTSEEARKVQEMGLVKWNGKTLQVDAAVKRKSMMRAIEKNMQASYPVYVMGPAPMTQTLLTDSGPAVNIGANAWSSEFNPYLHHNPGWRKLYM